MFAIITDSSAYLTKEQAEKLGVRVLSMHYSVSGRAFSEGCIDENGRFTELIASGKDLHTAHVPGDSFLRAFGELLRRGYDVLCLTISSRLSGVYSSALMAAKELNSDRIRVVDSLSVAGGLKFLVEKAAALSRQNCPLGQAAAELEMMRERVGIVFSVDDMEALRKSGRLGFVRQSVGTMLNLRPILFCKDGAVVASVVARGAQAQVAALVNSVPENPARVELHCITNRSGVELLREALKRKIGYDVEVCEIGPVLGIHLGLSVIGISWLCGTEDE